MPSTSASLRTGAERRETSLGRALRSARSGSAGGPRRAVHHRLEILASWYRDAARPARPGAQPRPPCCLAHRPDPARRWPRPPGARGVGALEANQRPELASPLSSPTLEPRLSPGFPWGGSCGRGSSGWPFRAGQVLPLTCEAGSGCLPAAGGGRNTSPTSIRWWYRCGGPADPLSRRRRVVRSLGLLRRLTLWLGPFPASLPSPLGAAPGVGRARFRRHCGSLPGGHAGVGLGRGRPKRGAAWLAARRRALSRWRWRDRGGHGPGPAPGGSPAHPCRRLRAHPPRDFADRPDPLGR